VEDKLEKFLQSIKNKIRDLETVIIVKLKLPCSLTVEQVSKIIEMYENKLNDIKIDDSMTPLEAINSISNLIKIVPVFHNSEEVAIEIISSQETKERLNVLEEKTAKQGEEIQLLYEKLKELGGKE
jgi:hypothetical protein